MNFRTTWFLVAVAVALGGYLWTTSRHAGRSVNGARGVAAEYTPIQPAEVVGIEVQRSNYVVSVVRSGDSWSLVKPVPHAALSSSVDALLNALGRMMPVDFVPGRQVATQPGGLAAFGLDNFTAVRLQTRDNRSTILHFGGPTPLAGQFYFQLIGTDGVFVADARVLAALPATDADWRDRGLVDLRRTPYDRLEIQQRGKTLFEARLEGQSWRLTKPLSARANGDALDALVQQLQAVRVSGFVSDGPLANAESMGLQPPEAEFVAGRGSNDWVRLQFGSSPPDQPGLVYVHRALQTNLVLVPTNVMQLVRLPLETFRDRRLLPPLLNVSSLEFQGPERFVARREGTNWFVVEPRRFPADLARIEETFQNLEGLGIEQFAADVVEDPSRYGLDRPLREYVLQLATNQAGVVTNVPWIGLQFGGAPTNTYDFVYTRRTDEPGVYAVVRSELARLPETANQLRDWRFSPSNVVSVTVIRSNAVRELVRAANGTWSVTNGPPVQGPLIGDALDETLYRLGNHNPLRYAVRDEKAALTATGCAQVAHELVLRFREGSGPLRRWRLRFGREIVREVSVIAYFDDDPVPLQLRFPSAYYRDVERDFNVP